MMVDFKKLRIPGVSTPEVEVVESEQALPIAGEGVAPGEESAGASEVKSASGLRLRLPGASGAGEQEGVDAGESHAIGGEVKSASGEVEVNTLSVEANALENAGNELDVFAGEGELKSSHSVVEGVGEALAGGEGGGVGSVGEAGVGDFAGVGVNVSTVSDADGGVDAQAGGDALVFEGNEEPAVASVYEALAGEGFDESFDAGEGFDESAGDEDFFGEEFFDSEELIGGEGEGAGDFFNPLLDESDEEVYGGAVYSTDGVVKKLEFAGGGKRFEPVEEAGEGDVFVGFDEQLQALMTDDDEGESLAPVGVEGAVTGEVVGEAGEGWVGTPVSNDFAKTVSELEGEALVRQELLRERALDSEGAGEVSSDFGKVSARAVSVNEAGETGAEARSPRQRTGRVKPGGKLKAGELEFFKSLSSVRSLSDGMLVEPVKVGELGRAESLVEKRARVEHLERVLDSRNVFRSGASFKLDKKTVDSLTFLALFRYATHSHLARMFGETPLTSLRRLRKLRDAGLVGSKKLYSQHAIWFLTEPGVVVSGYDVKHITESKLTPSMFPHQFTVNHVAANLMGGQLNVLNLDDFPSERRVGLFGQPVLGEQLTSELEILSSFSKLKLFEQQATFRPKLMGMRDQEFKKWSELPERGAVDSPELVFGNEWMFTLFPPLAVGTAYHVPDLVVKRKRAESGEPNNIAVEIEINNKPLASYEKTLRAYADDRLIFGQVIWVCKTVGPAKKLEKVGRDLGLIQSGRLKIVPIWTNSGVFKGRDLWMI